MTSDTESIDDPALGMDPKFGALYDAIQSALDKEPAVEKRLAKVPKTPEREGPFANSPSPK